LEISPLTPFGGVAANLEVSLSWSQSLASLHQARPGV